MADASRDVVIEITAFAFAAGPAVVAAVAAASCGGAFAIGVRRRACASASSTSGHESAKPSPSRWNGSARPPDAIGPGRVKFHGASSFAVGAVVLPRPGASSSSIRRESFEESGLASTSSVPADATCDVGCAGATEMMESRRTQPMAACFHSEDILRRARRRG